MINKIKLTIPEKEDIIMSITASGINIALAQSSQHNTANVAKNVKIITPKIIVKILKNKLKKIMEKFIKLLI